MRRHVCYWYLLTIYLRFILYFNSPLVRCIAAADAAFSGDYPQVRKLRQQSEKPHIVIILIDDMGFNDVSFHGSNQVVTPNIDALAYNGIILNRNYVPNLCTPSRSTLLTGKYPIHTGMHHFVIVNDEPWGLPLNQRLMPELFRDSGYSTYLVGKWHLGFYRKEMTPLYRGFDHHLGYYSGYIGYYDHTLKMLNRNYSGLDMRRDLEPCPELSGIYATDLFTREAVHVIRNHNVEKPLFLLMSHLAVHTGNEDNPMEAPEEELEKFDYISDPQRRAYAAMLSRLDQSVGLTVKALADKGILDNTIILLYSDNGAPTVGIHGNMGSNYPFRGQKESPWEGGIRSAALIWSPLLKQKNYVSNQVSHAIDWLPTLAAAANISLPEDLNLDGINLWPALSEAQESQPRRLLHVYDDIFGYSSYMKGNLKYVNGSSFEGKYDTWLGDINQDEMDPLSKNYEENILNSLVQQTLGDQSVSKELIQNLRQQSTHTCPLNSEDYTKDIYKCQPLKAPCYFDIEKDPCERYNLANLYPLQVEILAQEVKEYRLGLTPTARIPFPDARCNPLRFQGNWQWWYGTPDTSKAGKIPAIACNILLLT
ncbi:arylsulfatase B-like, partial [Lucilia sericata]|uniref:arylsulfatase B n=1 Tax=Lucilia sericata TaxID=13632 RepID=UPI0018A81112